MGADSQFATYPSLKDRVVLITGGATGIGEILVESFTQQQTQVIFLDTADEAAEALIDRLSSASTHTPLYFRCDLTDSVEVAEKIAGIIARFTTIDVVINNAGVDTRHKSEGVTPEFWDRCIAVNLKHQFFVSQAVVPGMKWQGREVILNMISLQRMAAVNAMTGYTASRAEIASLTRRLAHELEPHAVSVECVLPGAAESAQQRQHSYSEAYASGSPVNQAARTDLRPDQVEALAQLLTDDFNSLKD